MHRLFIKVIDKSKEPFERDGSRYIYTKLVEVKECNLGSIRNPNKNILGFEFVPIEYEQEMN